MDGLHKTDRLHAEELAAMDAIGRLKVVSKLVDADPEGSPACALLPYSTSRSRCEYAGVAVHLRSSEISEPVMTERGVDWVALSSLPAMCPSRTGAVRMSPCCRR